MSYAKPIWNDVTNCKYKGSKSYGNVNTGEVTVSVGSSSKNSHELVRHVTTRRFHDEYKGYENVCVFKFGVFVGDKEMIICEKIFKDNKGKAGDLITSIDYI